MCVHWHISSIVLICEELLLGVRVSWLVVGGVCRLVVISVLLWLLILVDVLGSSEVVVKLRPDLSQR